MRTAFAFASLVAGCGASPLPSPPHLARHELSAVPRLSAAELRAHVRPPVTDVRQVIRISITEGVSGRGFEGRGALVVRPGQALRMILLGPGGTTAMDVWIAGKRFRVAIPALDRVIRGDEQTPRSTMRGLPIDLLQRWLITPFGGTLVYARAGRVTLEGAVVGGEGVVAFTLFGREQLIRVREGDHERGWFFSGGALRGQVEGHVTAVGQALFPSDLDFEGSDPRMQVRVRAESTAVAEGLPASTFADPDAS